MRRTRLIGTAVVALSMTSTLLLAGCGNDSGTDPVASSDSPSPSSTSPSPSSEQPSDSPAASGQLPTVDGGFGEVPTVTIPDSDPPDSLKTKVLVKGDGATVASGDVLVVDYLGQIWKSGGSFDSSFERGQPVGFGIGVGQVIPGWDKALVGQTVGSRVLLVVPPADGYGSAGQPDAGIAGDDTLVFVVDILGTHAKNETAKGTPSPTEDDSLPAVTILPKEPEISIPPGDAPPKFFATAVVTGKGPKVKKGDVVVVQYLGKIWKTGKVFDSTWDRGQPAAFPIGIGGVIAGWDNGLVGQRVGSRLLLVIPPADGYGSAGQPDAGIAGDDTLVFAVDILGAY